MGLSTEQTVAVIEAVGNAVRPENKQDIGTNYWWLLLIAIVPVLLGYWINKRRKK